MRTRPLPKRYSGDDFVMTIEGEEFRPHTGEYVEVWPVLSIRETRQAARLLGVMRRGMEFLSTEELSELETLAGEFLKTAAANIISWDLTDIRTGKKLPKATAQILDSLSVEEFTWITVMFAPDGDKE